MVCFFQADCGLQLAQQEVLKGYSRKADSMFVARLVKY